MRGLGLRLAAVGAFALVLAGQAHAARIVIGKPAPDFHATMLDNTKVGLADFKGQVLILNFWATWCGPCKTELPLLNAYVKIQQIHGLRALAVTTEDSLPVSQLKGLSAALAIPMVRYFHGVYSYPDGLPTNYIIDRAGVIRYAQAGAFSLNELNTILAPLLAQAAPDPAPPPAQAPSQAPPQAKDAARPAS